MTFRLAYNDDLPLIEQIWMSGLIKMDPLFVINDQLIHLFRQNFNNRNVSFNFWVAEDERVVGWCSVLPAFSHPFKQRSHGEVSVYIDEKHESNGVGRELMKFVFKVLENSEIQCIFGFAGNSNHKSIKMCENAGMTICGKTSIKTILIKEYK